MVFWLVILSAKFSFAYFLQVRVIFIAASKLELCICLFMCVYVGGWINVACELEFFICGLQIKPLVAPTRDIIKENNIVYSWHDFVSKSKQWSF